MKQLCENIGAKVPKNGRTTVGFSINIFGIFWLPENTVVIPHTSYSPTLPIKFFCSPKIKFWLTGYHSDMIGEILAELQKMLQTLTLLDSSDTWKHGKHTGITVSIPKVTISKKTMETRCYGNFLLANSLNFWVAPHIMVNNCLYDINCFLFVLYTHLLPNLLTSHYICSVLKYNLCISTLATMHLYSFQLFSTFCSLMLDYS